VRFAVAPLVLVGLAVAPAVRADLAPGAAPPRYADLPQGRVSAPPAAAERPASIPRTESVAGFFVAAPRSAQVPPRQPTPSRFNAKTFTSVPGSSGIPSPVTPLIVAGSPAAADAGRNGVASAEEPKACLGQATSFPGAVAALAGPLAGEWSNLTAQVGILARGPGSVVAIHAERVVEDGGFVRLESTDAWLDPTTRGTRLIGKTSLPLRLVASEPGGFDVLAGRDERPDGKRIVQFVVRRRKDAPLPAVHGAFGLALLATRVDGTGALPTTTGCSHFRIPMPVAPNSAETATIQLSAVLPPLAPGERSSATPAPDFGVPSTVSTREVRTRPLHLHFGVSQLASEREPLLAVSASWAGREQLQRVAVGPGAVPAAAF
jgi:hypothetical protein